jgi:hypothetical protein
MASRSPLVFHPMHDKRIQTVIIAITLPVAIIVCHGRNIAMPRPRDMDSVALMARMHGQHVAARHPGLPHERKRSLGTVS